MTASISGVNVTQLIRDGVLGTIYQLICTATLSNSEVLILGGYLAVIPPL